MAPINRSHEELLKQLLQGPRLTAEALPSVDKVQGVYVWWLSVPPTTCLKVGRAFLGARKEGLRRRIGQHLSSNFDNSVLARHLAADKASIWDVGQDLTERSARKRFLATQCEFQVLALPDKTQAELNRFEKFVESSLQPRYIDYVRAGLTLDR